MELLLLKEVEAISEASCHFLSEFAGRACTPHRRRVSDPSARVLSRPDRMKHLPLRTTGLSWRIVYDVLYSKGITRYEVQ